MTVVRKIVLGYANIVILAIIMVVVGILQMRTLQSGYNEYTNSTRAQVTAANQIAVGTASMGGAIIAAVATQDKTTSDQYVASLQQQQAQVKQALDTLAASETGADQSESQAISVQLDQFNQAVSDTLAILSSSRTIAQNDVLTKVLPLSQELNAAANKYSEDEKAQADTALNGLHGIMTRLFIILIAMTGVIVLGAALLGGYITRSIRQQLRAAVASIGSSTSEMLAMASQVAAGTTQTAAATNQTTATVEEVKQTALLANEKANQVAESSQNVARTAEQGRAAVEDTIMGIERMQSQMGVVAETINRLSEQTQAVGDIISTVSDLAEQSNLLSVNASIEAAKAGDHGKGFTVVAQEVKSLAEQSKQAVAQVRTILSEIQKAGNMAVQAAEQGREAIEAGRQQSLESGEAIQMLADSVNEAVQSAVQIAASSRQQLAGMEQISQAIEAINQAGNQSASGTRQVEHEVRQLQDLAVRLRRLVDAGTTA